MTDASSEPASEPTQTPVPPEPMHENSSEVDEAEAQAAHYPIVVSLATLRPHQYAALASRTSMKVRASAPVSAAPAPASAAPAAEAAEKRGMSA